MREVLFLLEGGSKAQALVAIWPDLKEKIKCIIAIDDQDIVILDLTNLPVYLANLEKIVLLKYLYIRTDDDKLDDHQFFSYTLELPKIPLCEEDDELLLLKREIDKMNKSIGAFVL